MVKLISPPGLGFMTRASGQDRHIPDEPVPDPNILDSGACPELRSGSAGVTIIGLWAFFANCYSSTPTPRSRAVI